MSALNIVIIARTIIPDLSPRAFRATELAKEFARKGQKITLYAVLGEYDYTNFQNETGVIVKNIGKMLFATSNSDGHSRYTIFDKILYHTFYRLMEFPDIELAFRIPSIIKTEKNCNLLITVAYPHPIHWGATMAKKKLSVNKFPLVWISDCGDPYMGDPINIRKFFYFKYIEKWWGRNTDFITIPLKEGVKGYYKEFSPKIKVIAQGSNLENVKIDNSFTKNEIPTFAYAGSIYPGKRDPSTFLNFLATLNQNFKFVIFSNNFTFYEPFKLLLKEKLELKPYIPRDRLIYELSKMDFLINLKNPNTVQLPSKIIDYLLTKRPIIEVSLNFPYSEMLVFMEFINRNYEQRLKGFDLTEFDIKNVAQKFIELYYDSISERPI